MEDFLMIAASLIILYYCGNWIRLPSMVRDIKKQLRRIADILENSQK